MVAEEIDALSYQFVKPSNPTGCLFQRGQEFRRELLVGLSDLFPLDFEFLGGKGDSVVEACVMEKGFISSLSHVVQNGPNLPVGGRVLGEGSLFQPGEVCLTCFFCQPKDPNCPPTLLTLKGRGSQSVHLFNLY